MSQKLTLFKQSLKNKRVTVLGIGVSNVPLIRFLAENGACVTACDRQSAENLSEQMQALAAFDITYRLGEGYMDDLSGEVIFKTPGMRFDLPQLVKAREAGSHVTSEMEVFFELCPCKIIAVTGSDGKTTTTTLISEILKQAGYKVWVGGNIGMPLVGELDHIGEKDIAVLELSSFQLHTMQASPNVAVITNLAPNHLDWHTDMQEYLDAKKNIFLHQSAEDMLVLNADNDITSALDKEARGRVSWFSSAKQALDGAYLKNGVIYLNGEAYIQASDIKIPGAHNVENFMTAIAATQGLASKEDVEYIAKNFGGVEHRIEFVRELDGVRYYNDSIASSPSRARAGLRSFDKKVILIAGGYDKNLDYTEFGAEVKAHVKTLVLVGATSDKIEAACLAAGMEHSMVVRCTEFAQAIHAARDAAQAGDIVLLSPASASFDLFKNFMERGKVFKEIVNSL
ncbi:MAG: UDP-N-acetylmuramoyl-L-alanine--D-glutamate ligase [Clostridia bacterium]|nr:UDP-N-acetylmuramoyl-L-alanine--D-glutamate ligase [Clostridia bacterium]